MKGIFGIFDFLYIFFLQELPRKFHFQDLVNEIKISNFYKHFIYKNFAMSYKISGFVGFTG